MADLLRSFVNEDWVAQVDFTTLEKVGGSYVTDDLIEPVPASLSAYRPRLRYFLMDEGRLLSDSLERADNAVASLLQLERSASPGEIARIVGQLAEKLRAPQNRELRRALTVWIRRVVLRRFAPEGEMIELDDLPEAHHMISERVESWTQEWLRQGRLQGLQQGQQQGLQQGLRAGQATALRTLMEQRFGPLPADVEVRLAGADLACLQGWLGRILTVESLSALMGDH